VSSKTYLYFFTRIPPGPDADRLRTYHASDVVYVFGNLGKSPFPYSNRAYDATDRKLSDMMGSYWVNFAKSGNPNGGMLPHWPAYDPTNDQLLELGDSVRIRAHVRQERMDFMDRYFDNLRRSH